MEMFLDLDGPILDVSKKYYRVYADLVYEFGGSPIIESEYWREKRNRTPIRDILSYSSVTDYEGYSSKRIEIIESLEYLKIDSTWPGTTEALEKISGKSPLYLVTARRNRTNLIKQLEWLGILDFFTSIISPNDQELELPKNDLKKTMVWRELGEVPLNGWFIGDTDTDTVAGNLLGLNTGVVAYGIRSEEIVLNYGADIIFKMPTDFDAWVEKLFGEIND